MLSSDMLKSDLKKHAALYGIFFGIIFFVFAVLVAMTFLSRNSWKNGLASEVQKVLNAYAEDTYTVNKFIDIDSPVSTSAAAYSLIKKGAASGEAFYGVIIRIPTITGPAAAVFVSSEKNQQKGQNVRFAGFAENFGKADGLTDTRLSSSNIGYWESVVSRIIEKSLAKQGER